MKAGHLSSLAPNSLSDHKPLTGFTKERTMETAAMNRPLTYSLFDLLQACKRQTVTGSRSPPHLPDKV